MATKEWNVQADTNDYSVVCGHERVAGYITSLRRANLIAASPMLLDALKALRHNVDTDLSGFWTESTSNFIQMADEAIAKASGGALWAAEFPGYDVPDAVEDEPGVEDVSWHNDICPSFTFAAVAELGLVDLRLWVEHPDPEQREAGPNAPRYAVMLDSEETYSGDDVDAALVNLRANRDAILKTARKA